MAFVRRVVTGRDRGGRAAFLSDAPPPRTIEVATGFGVSDVLVFDGPPRDASSGGDPSGSDFPLHPAPGGATVRVIRIPPPAAGAGGEDRWLRVAGEDPARRGWHTTDTLDFEVILDGELVLELDDGEHLLGRGDAVVQRGTGHRWRVVGDRPCTYLAAMLRPDPGAGAVPLALALRTGSASGPGPRRLVSATDAAGRSFAAVFGPPAQVFQPAGPGDVTLSELWQTGGPLRRADQGGDPPAGWSLEPLGGGVAFRMLELPAGHDPGEAGWHTTRTIDVDVIVSGQVELALPGAAPVVVGPGGVVVQRATEHRWRPVGSEALRMAALMFSLPG